MALPYVSGNWTFSAETQPTSTTTKSITLPNVNWSADYSLSDKMPSPKEELKTDTAMYYSDTTGTGLQRAALFSVGRKTVRNIYEDTEIPASARLPQLAGKKALEQYSKIYRATNSVSGQEMEFPLKGNFFVNAPMWSAIPKEVLDDFIADFVAHILASAADPSAYLFLALKGDLDFRS